MARYYSEIYKNKTEKVIAQDETGVYVSVGSEAVQVEEVRNLWVMLPEWREPRKVSTADREYLEYKRLFERNSYTYTQPTPILELQGTAQEVIKAVIAGRSR